MIFLFWKSTSFFSVSEHLFDQSLNSPKSEHSLNICFIHFHIKYIFWPSTVEWCIAFYRKKAEEKKNQNRNICLRIWLSHVLNGQFEAINRRRYIVGRKMFIGIKFILFFCRLFVSTHFKHILFSLQRFYTQMKLTCSTKYWFFFVVQQIMT